MRLYKIHKSMIEGESTATKHFSAIQAAGTVDDPATVEKLMDSFQPNLKKLTITDGDEGVKGTGKKRPKPLQDKAADDDGDENSDVPPLKKVKPAGKGTGGKGTAGRKNSKVDKGKASVDKEVTQYALIALKVRTRKAALKLGTLSVDNRIDLACVESLDKAVQPLQKLIEAYEEASMSPSQDSSGREAVVAAYHKSCKEGDLKLLHDELEFAELRIARLSV